MIEGQSSFLDNHVDSIGTHAQDIDIHISSRDIEIIEVKHSARWLMDDGADASHTVNIQITPVRVSVELGSGDARVGVCEGVIDEEVETWSCIIDTHGASEEIACEELFR